MHTNLEDLLNTKMENVIGGLSSNDCFCDSGAGQNIIIVPEPEPPYKNMSDSPILP